ncbi:hypothetical protein SELMODRAFT_419502 [Selaginella moellendorffii]|uniref:Uncharacterized protein n=1 Tax=Selaginella moellendorffii TaxID=88036 RepID=D8S956_SELML|nr:hypothetical protein SELMODRAFT_419502 [Selaginella moellendorffii]
MADTEIQPVAEIADPEIQPGLRLRNLSLKRICYWVRECLRRAAAVAVSDNPPADAAMQINGKALGEQTPSTEFGQPGTLGSHERWETSCGHMTTQQHLPLVAANTNLNTELWDIIRILTLWTIYRERIDVLYHHRTQPNDIRAAVSFWSDLLVSLASRWERIKHRYDFLLLSHQTSDAWKLVERVKQSGVFGCILLMGVSGCGKTKSTIMEVLLDGRLGTVVCIAGISISIMQMELDSYIMFGVAKTVNGPPGFVTSFDKWERAVDVYNFCKKYLKMLGLTTANYSRLFEK